MQHARLATAVALFWGVISLLWPTAVEAWQNPISSWNTVRLKATTEDDFVYRFGIPDFVEWQMPWVEFLRNRASATDAETYSLKYVNFRDSLPFLSGPLGRASSGWAEVENRKITALGWEYCCNYREPAYSRWLGDASFSMGTNQKILIGSKKLSQGQLFLSCPMQKKDLKCSGDITVYF
ncbi:MAG: hypothetical protein L0Z50_13335, partial [Verrucomicrobiales bacterium]|nr:hypothetical protein [Verrucomicrobiales bacterium]